MCKVFMGEKDGYLMLYTPTETINLHKAFKEAGAKPDNYSFDTLKASVIELLKNGVNYQGVLLFLRGKLDSKRELKRYAIFHNLSLDELKRIVKPNRP